MLMIGCRLHDAGYAFDPVKPIGSMSQSIRILQ